MRAKRPPHGPSRRFRRNERAIAAVEFALVLPLMLFVFVGVSEVGQAVEISRKVTLTTRIVTDLVTQYANVSSATLSTVLGASAEVIAPFSASNLVMTVSEVYISSSGNATVAWSQSLNGRALVCGSKFTLPSQLNQSSSYNTYLIYGQVTYTFTPVLGYKIIGTIPIADQIYMSPRLTNSIPYAPAQC
jgi:Flp pilus assembly protein TadG